MNVMTYKGYAARIEYSEADECFVGHIAGIREIMQHGFCRPMNCYAPELSEYPVI